MNAYSLGSTDLESVSRDVHLVVTVSTKFEVDTTTHCLVIELVFLSLTAEALQGKTCQNSQPSGVGRSLSQNFREKGSSLGNIFWFLQN